MPLNVALRNDSGAFESPGPTGFHSASCQAAPVVAGFCWMSSVEK